MSATIHQLRPTAAIAGYIRVGHNGHKWLDEQLAADRLPFRRFVFEAAHIREQKHLLDALRKAGCEIVLDPNFAELGSEGKFGSSAASLPWAHPDRPWEPGDFGRGRNFDIATQIAEFAVEQQVHAILSPSHVEAANDEWRVVDLNLASALRGALDRSGGRHIAIDYQLITRITTLRDDGFLERAVADLGGVEFDNLWLRVSSFGAHATGEGTRRFIEGVGSFHDLGRPIVSDMTGGLAALAAASFGAIGGVSHGIALREDFRDSEYLRKKRGGGGGGGARIYIAELDRYLTAEQLSSVLAARGARTRLVCRDTSCCPNGRDDMVEQAKRHFTLQRAKQLEDLSRVPEARRAEHYLLNHLAPAVRTSRLAANYKIDDHKVTEVLAKESQRLVRMQDALSALYESGSLDARSRAPSFRGSQGTLAVLIGQI
jgi:hypothetical protein